MVYGLCLLVYFFINAHVRTASYYYIDSIFVIFSQHEYFSFLSKFFLYTYIHIHRVKHSNTLYDVIQEKKKLTYSTLTLWRRLLIVTIFLWTLIVPYGAIRCILFSEYQQSGNISLEFSRNPEFFTSEFLEICLPDINVYPT